MNRYCFDSHHSEPCPHTTDQPCVGCLSDCHPEDYADTSVNRERTIQWENRLRRRLIPTDDAHRDRLVRAQLQLRSDR